MKVTMNKIVNLKKNCRHKCELWRESVIVALGQLQSMSWRKQVILSIIS